jgi:release factor glutamine methyltransferase
MNESELLLTKLLNCDKASLYLMRDSVLDTGVSAKLADALQRRLGGEPLAYITGETEFMGLSFTVSPACLIPRPETEILVETALRYIKRNSFSRILDAGTGSGCIAVSLAHFMPSATIEAFDISDEALAVARGNAERNSVSVKLFKHDMIRGGRWKVEGGRKNSEYDVIVTNPPYIVSDEIAKLQIEVRHEPRSALDGGADGLAFYRALPLWSAAALRQDGMLLCEIGYGQSQSVRNILQKCEKFEIIEVVKDYSGIERVVVARRCFEKVNQG